MSLLLAGTMTAGMLVGCGGTDGENAQKDKGGKEEQNQDGQGDASADGSKELSTVKILCKNDFSESIKIEDWEDSEFSKQFIADLEELGLRVEVECISGDSEAYKQVVNTRMASGEDMPDLISNFGGVSKGDVFAWGERGLIYNLDELLEQYDEDGSIVAHMEAALPEAWTSQKDPNDGRHYYFFGYNTDAPMKYVYEGETYPNTYSYQVSIRKDWVEAVGEAVKEVYTPDELFDLLKKIQEEDANGNGMPDEVVRFSADNFISSPCMAWGLGADMLVNYYGTDNEVFCNFYHENFPAYIEFMKKLYDNGLYDTEALSTSSSEMLAADHVSAIYDYVNWDYEASLPSGGENGQIYVPVYLELDGDITNGVNVKIDPYFGSADNAYFIPKSAGNVEGVIRLMDYIYSEKYAMLDQLGIEGYSYEIDENGSYKMLKHNDRITCFYGGGLAGFALPNILEYSVVKENGKAADCDKEYLQADFDYYQNFEMNIFDNPNNQFMVSVTYYAPAKTEEKEILDEITTPLETYASELLTDLILEKRSLEDLPQYQKEMEDLGLLDYLDIMQARRNRYLGIE